MFDGRPDRAGRPRRRGFLPELRIHLLELRDLPAGSPTQIAVAGIAQVDIRKLLEPARPVEAGSTFVGDCLIVDEAVVARRADGLFIQTFGVEVAALQSGDFRADQRGAVREILGTILRPDLEPLVMSIDGL